MCYVFSVVSYGCETWTYSKAIYHKINDFEMCVTEDCWQLVTSNTTHIDVLQKICVKETTMFKKYLKNRKLSYAGHIMRNTSGHYDTLLTTMEGRRQTRKREGRPRRAWMDDLRDWTGSIRYDQTKRASDRRNLHGTLKFCIPQQWTQHWMKFKMNVHKK